MGRRGRGSSVELRGVTACPRHDPHGAPLCMQSPSGRATARVRRESVFTFKGYPVCYVTSTNHRPLHISLFTFKGYPAHDDATPARIRLCALYTSQHTALHRARPFREKDDGGQRISCPTRNGKRVRGTSRRSRSGGGAPSRSPRTRPQPPPELIRGLGRAAPPHAYIPDDTARTVGFSVSVLPAVLPGQSDQAVGTGRSPRNANAEELFFLLLSRGRSDFHFFLKFLFSSNK